MEKNVNQVEGETSSKEVKEASSLHEMKRRSFLGMNKLEDMWMKIKNYRR